MYNDDFDDEDYCGYDEDDNERDLFLYVNRWSIWRL